MPYIPQTSREQIDPLIPALSDQIQNVGDLNYVITRLALRLLDKQGVKYENISGVVGTVHLVADEMVRRLIGDYENYKIEQNGDVQEYANLLLRMRTSRNAYDHAPDAVQTHG